MAKKISQLTQATQVKSDDVAVIVQDGETKKLPLNTLVTKQDIENKKVAGLAKLDEIEATYENDTYTPTITVKNKSSVKVGEGDGVDYSANVMDGHAKSAILKGQTLVNLAPKKIIEYTASSDWDGFNVLVQNSKRPNERWRTLQDLKPNTKYYISCYVETFEDVNGRHYHLNNSNDNCLFVDFMKINGVGHYQWISTTRSELTDEIYIALRCQNAYARGAIKIRDIMIIEYQQGMENWDIPYFEGMKSVKLPVLTTVGKNLLNPSLLIETPYAVVDGGNATINILRDKREWAWVEIYRNLNLPVGNYYILCEVIDGAYIGGNLGVWDNNLKLEEFGISNGINLFSFNNCSISKLGLWQPAGNNNCKLRLSIYTNSNRSYEPYKSNILTVNEEVELRGIGGVRDELNCLTGEVTQRIGEMILDGSETWFLGTTKEKTQVFYIPDDSDKIVDMKKNTLILCDKLKVASGIDEEIIVLTSSIYLGVLKSKASTVEELKVYLSQNPITIQYQLETESIKTVDLMPSGTHPSTTPYCWKNGHIQLSSSGLLPNLEYSVVTSRAGQINQNATMVVKNDKRIFDLEILLAGGLVNTTYQALTLQNQVETGLSKVSLSSEKEPDYLLYHMIMKLIEEKAYKLDDLTEKVSVFYLYEKLSDEQFETIYSALYPFVEDEIVEEPVVEELPEAVEDEVIM